MKIDTRLPVSNWTHVYHDHKGFFKLPVLFCFFELRILFLFFFFFFFFKANRDTEEKLYGCSLEI